MKRHGYNTPLWTSFLLTSALLAPSPRVWGCSAFSPKNSYLLAANYDWRARGGMIVTNPAGLQKTAFVKPGLNPGQAARWISRYGSVTLTQWGREFPVQGMNTQGLSGVLLNGPGSWDQTNSKPQITEQQWLQHQLDLYQSVEEVSKHADDLKIRPIGGGLHYFFCDGTSACVWIEFTQGEARTHRSDQLEGLRGVTNSDFNASQARWDSYLAVGGNASSLPQTYDSLDRFLRANWFGIYGDVSEDQAFWGLRNLSGRGLTQWHTVFDTASQALSVYAAGVSTKTTVALAELDFTCKPVGSSRYLEIASSQTKMRPYRQTWKDYDSSYALTLLRAAAKPARGFTEPVIEAMIAYPSSLTCAN